MPEILRTELQTLEKDVQEVLFNLARSLILMSSKQEIVFDINNIAASGAARMAIIDQITASLTNKAIDPKIIAVDGSRTFRSDDWERLVHLLKDKRFIEDLLEELQALINTIK